MASTYSPLKIELIGTGEQSGVWGTTTNTNLGTAIEEAITGSADVAFSSADVTVTLTNTNASQAARNLRLNLTGTSGGARNLILGSGCQIEKLYLINNGLADAVTVKNTSGTGIAVPAGKTMFVYNNGTNVVDAVTHLTSLTTGTLSASGVATFSAGSVSAPAITTSGDTNTGIFFPAADTIAFTEGGTEAMRLDSSGNVGIGTDTPTERLSIYGGTGVSAFTSYRANANAAATEFLVGQSSSSNTAFIFNRANGVINFGTNNLERMRIDSSGNVGIGTSSPAAKLQVNTGAAGTVGQIIQMFTSQTADALRVTRSDANNSLQFTPSGQLSIGDIAPAAATTITTGPATTTNANLKITGSNVGNPNLLLQSMNGGGGSIGGPTSFVYFGDNNRALSYIGGTKVNAFASNASSDLVFGTTPDISATAVTERMRIDSSGNVGINTTSPGVKLGVVDTSAGAATFPAIFGNRGTTVGTQVNFGLQTYDSGSAGITNVIGSVTTSATSGAGSADMVFLTTASATRAERMRIGSDGKVGIGTTTLTNLLNVAGAIQSSSTLVAVAANTVALSQESGYSRLAAFGPNASTGGTLYLYSISSNGGVQNGMVIDSVGKVGIGITSPSRALHVATGVLTLGNSAGALFTDTNNAGVLLGSDNAIGYISGVTAAGTGTAKLLLQPFGEEVLVAATTDNGAYNLQCNGTGVWGAGAYVNGSDERIKEDIAPIQSGLDVVQKLNPVTYKYKETWSKDQSTQTGFIAQELLTALEGEVYIDGVVQQGGQEEYYSVAYQNIIPILTKAIQEQQQIINDLKARIETLESK